MTMLNGVKAKTKGKPKSNTNKDGDGTTLPRSGVTNTMIVSMDDTFTNTIKNTNKSNQGTIDTMMGSDTPRKEDIDNLR